MIKHIMKLETEFPKYYSDYVEKEYGILFYNINNPVSWDSNHVILKTDKIIELNFVLEDIMNFYLSKSLSPKIYHHQDNYIQINQHIFKQYGFNIDQNVNEVMVLTEHNHIETANNLNLYRLKKYDERILLDIFQPDQAEYDALTIERAIENNNFHFIMGEVDGKFVSCASILYQDGIGRIDHVSTAPSQRKKGYARELISYLVEYHKEHSDGILYEWPANETAKKIYFEAGFRYLFSFKSNVAYIK